MGKTFIFDLDGVVADTAKYHYRAWKELAEYLGFDLPDKAGEQIKGVSRLASLNIILKEGGYEGLAEGEKERLAEWKNERYLELIRGLKPSDILPGILEFLTQVRNEGCQTALGSASKSGTMILEKLEIDRYFDAVVDGRHITRAKPDPEVFLTAAEMLGVNPKDCIVIEDAQAGVRAARAGGMHCIGIGDADRLREADLVLENTNSLLQVRYWELFSKTKGNLYQWNLLESDGTMRET